MRVCEQAGIDIKEVIVVTFSTMTHVIYWHAVLSKKLCTRLSDSEHRNDYNISIHHRRPPISRKPISDQRARPLIPKATGKVTRASSDGNMPAMLGCSKDSSCPLPNTFSDTLGKPSETLDFSLALEETLLVDSEKPDKDDIITSGNERAAPSHYETRELSNIGDNGKAQVI